MKKLSFGIIIGILLSVSVALIGNETFFKGRIVYMLQDNGEISLRPNGNVLTTLKKGTPLVVVESEGEWVKVAISGYAPKSILTGEVNKLRGAAISAQMIVLNSQADAEKALAEVKGGKDFGTVAKEKSVDKATATKNGNLGEFYPGDFSPQIEEVILALKAGQISKVVNLGGKYYVFKRVK